VSAMMTSLYWNVEEKQMRETALAYFCVKTEARKNASYGKHLLLLFVLEKNLKEFCIIFLITVHRRNNKCVRWKPKINFVCDFLLTR
jgi:hypothetical protein